MSYPVALSPRVRAVLPGWHGPQAPAPTHQVPGAGDALERALGWVEGALPRFDPAADGRARPGPPGSALLELVVVLRQLYHQDLPAPLAARVGRCLDGAAEAFLRGGFRHRMLRATPYFQYYAWLVACLLDTGRLPAAERDALQHLVDRGHADLHNPTHPPHGVLELRYVLDLAGVTHRLPDHRTLYEADVLAAPLDPLYVTEVEAYAVTHVVYYLSDMGLIPLHSLDEAQHADCVHAVDTLLDLYLCFGNWDLIAELLLCRPTLGAEHTPRDQYALECLLLAQHADGSMPGPHFDPRMHEALPAERRADYAFARSYHTTLVVAMTLADRLYGQGRPDARNGAAR
ncbi:hypothetical protein [Streptomyces sp. NPDC048442]|uniref:DUF6895 family protein n=1 Tax=Streptomyces sp. NPDC048442 TaxID=3154823 RepID=UPI0034436D34